MAEHRSQTVTGDQSLDGNVYVNCQFRDAQLFYSGGEPPRFDGCTFDNATFTFDGAAGQTLNFLNSMAPRSTNMRDVVLGLIPGLTD